MIKRADQFLIREVFQPLVDASGWSVDAWMRAGYGLLVVLFLSSVAWHWTALGRVDASGLICAMLMSLFVPNRWLREAGRRGNNLGWRMFLVGGLFWDMLLAGGGLAGLIPYTAANALGLAQSVVWVGLTYIAACQNPPPRRRVAYAFARG